MRILTWPTNSCGVNFLSFLRVAHLTRINTTTAKKTAQVSARARNAAPNDAPPVHGSHIFKTRTWSGAQAAHSEKPYREIGPEAATF